MKQTNMETINAYIAYFKISFSEIAYFLNKYADQEKRIVGWYNYMKEKEFVK